MIDTTTSILVFVLGLLLVVFTLDSAVRTFVLPRGENVILTRLVFGVTGAIFDFWARSTRNPRRRENIRAMYAPVSLLWLAGFWLALVLAGFMATFWAAGVRGWSQAFLLSGSSLLTLGFAPVSGNLQTVLAFVEATIGLMLIALLIAYLPTMYAAISRRETAVAMLETYADAPPSPIRLITRIERIHGLAYLGELWKDWELWFAEVGESHTTFAPLVYFRSPKALHHWVTSAGALLDAASMTLSAVDIPFDPRAALCIRSGYLALQGICEINGFQFNPNPSPDDPISITRGEFDTALHTLDEEGVPLKTDLDQAWRDFSGWRVNYDAVLLSLAAMTYAPQALWSADRARLLPKKSKKNG